MFPSRVHPSLISDMNYNISTWTYHNFDKPKVIVMGNGYDVLGYRGVIVTFLLVR